jgi:hypothetical protein
MRQLTYKDWTKVAKKYKETKGPLSKGAFQVGGLDRERQHSLPFLTRTSLAGLSPIVNDAARSSGPQHKVRLLSKGASKSCQGERNEEVA